MMKATLLTKSRYFSGRQCVKRVWLEWCGDVEPEFETESQRRRKCDGLRVGELARGYCGKGELIAGVSTEEAVVKTLALMDAGAERIFEAAVQAGDLLVRIDVLERGEGGSWKIVEVKATSKVKPEHIVDVAFQKYVAERAGFLISSCSVMHLNKDCVFPELSDLFVDEDVTDKVEKLGADFSQELALIREALQSTEEPKVHVSSHCKKPHRCPYWEYCWKDIPGNSIFTIPRLAAAKEQALIEKGVIKISDIADGFELSSGQRAYVEMVQSGESEIDREAIKERLGELEWPIYFFDIETDAPVIPRFSGMGPFAMLCFQFSCHVLREDGELQHFEFLHREDSDSREPFIQALLNVIGPSGSVVVYHASFEGSRLRELGEWYPR